MFHQGPSSSLKFKGFTEQNRAVSLQWETNASLCFSLLLSAVKPVVLLLLCASLSCLGRHAPVRMDGMWKNGKLWWWRRWWFFVKNPSLSLLFYSCVQKAIPVSVSVLLVQQLIWEFDNVIVLNMKLEILINDNQHGFRAAENYGKR